MATDRLDQLTIERLIDAPIDSVWRAWTTEAGLATWWWAGWNDTTYDVDLRVGGTYRISAPSVGISVSGEFIDVSPPHHLHMTWIWEDDDGTGQTEHVTVNLDEHESRTNVKVHHSGPWTTTEPASNYRQGWNHVLDALSTTRP